MEKLRLSKNQFKEAKEQDRLTNLAKLYAEVFAGPPWNEFTKSVGCDRFFGQDTRIGDPCPTCYDILQEAYPLEETILYIQKELSRPNAVLALLEKESLIIGFAWGFSYDSSTSFIEEKYKTKEMKNNLSSLFTQFRLSDSFFYFSECGVAPAFRRQGLSNGLSEELVRQAEILGQPLLMRTNYQSPMVHVASRFGMEQIMGSRGSSVINFQDMENKDRVLFLKS